MELEEKTYLYKAGTGSSHNWAKLNLKDLPPESQVLDFGAGAGFIGQHLKAQGVTKIFAVEIDPIRQQHLQKIYMECASNINELSPKKYDCIILLDILEHLTNPFETLSSLSSYLNPGGTILISVPNIAHWSMRLGLLFGFFEYTNRGLLDRTHFSFFNKRRAIKLAQSLSDCQLIQYAVSTSPAELVLPNWLTENKWYALADVWRLKISNILPGILGYQHLMKIRKNKCSE